MVLRGILVFTVCLSVAACTPQFRTQSNTGPVPEQGATSIEPEPDSTPEEAKGLIIEGELGQIFLKGIYKFLDFSVPSANAGNLSVVPDLESIAESSALIQELQNDCKSTCKGKKIAEIFPLTLTKKSQEAVNLKQDSVTDRNQALLELLGGCALMTANISMNDSKLSDLSNLPSAMAATARPKVRAAPVCIADLQKDNTFRMEFRTKIAADFDLESVLFSISAIEPDEVIEFNQISVQNGAIGNKAALIHFSGKNQKKISAKLDANGKDEVIFTNQLMSQMKKSDALLTLDDFKAALESQSSNLTGFFEQFEGSTDDVTASRGGLDGIDLKETQISHKYKLMQEAALALSEKKSKERKLSENQKKGENEVDKSQSALNDETNHPKSLLADLQNTLTEQGYHSKDSEDQALILESDTEPEKSEKQLK